MTGAAREPDQADFDLERFINLFDEAMTSKDPRVVETLRSLLMIVTLTRSEAYNEHDRRSGPLRRLFEDMHDLNRRVSRQDEEIRDIANAFKRSSQSYRWDDLQKYPYEKYTMQAAQEMSSSIDQDLLAKLNTMSASKIKGLK